MSKKKRKPKYTELKKHKRNGKEILSKLNTLPLVVIDWNKDFIPEFLWIDSLAQMYSNLHWHKIFDDFIDILEKPLGNDKILLGFLSDFAKVPEQTRSSILNKHKKFITYAFAEPIGRLVSLYPLCPASWLIPPDWKASNKIDIEEELKKLEKTLMRLFMQNDEYCSYIRMMPLKRIVKHGKLHIRQGMEVAELLPKYPIHLTKEEREHVESFGREVVNQTFMVGYSNGDISTEWPKHFWRHNFTMSPCRFHKEDLSLGNDESERELL
jgi:hypothetical protein